MGIEASLTKYPLPAVPRSLYPAKGSPVWQNPGSVGATPPPLPKHLPLLLKEQILSYLQGQLLH